MFLIGEPRSSDIRRIQRDGFLVVERLIEPEAAARLAARFGPLFRGEFETGLYPDEWNWREGKRRRGPDSPELQCVEVGP